PPLQFGPAEEVAPTDDDRDLHPVADHGGDLAGHLLDDVRVDTDLTAPELGAGELEHHPTRPVAPGAVGAWGRFREGSVLRPAYAVRSLVLRPQRTSHVRYLRHPTRLPNRDTLDERSLGLSSRRTRPGGAACAPACRARHVRRGGRRVLLVHRQPPRVRLRPAPPRTAGTGRPRY